MFEAVHSEVQFVFANLEVEKLEMKSLNNFKAPFCFAPKPLKVEYVENFLPSARRQNFIQE